MTDTCSLCREPVRYVLTVEGRRLAVNPDPDPAGVVVRVDDGDTVRAKVLTGVDLPALEPAWTPHARTCPQSPEAARRNAIHTPRCRACRERMDPWLVANGYPAHVCCLPPIGLRDAVQAARDTAREGAA